MTQPTEGKWLHQRVNNNNTKFKAAGTVNIRRFCKCSSLVGFISTAVPQSHLDAETDGFLGGTHN